MGTTAEELVLRITGDSEGAKLALKSLEEHVENTAKAFASSVAEGFGPMGVAAGVAAGAAVALGTALFELGEHATELAAELQRVSLTTGIAVPALTDLKFALDSTGGSLDQLNTVMFMFEQRMVNSSSKVEAGLKMIGLSLEQIDAMSHDQQLLAISAAMQTAGEGTNLAAAAMDIFGRQGRTILPELVMPLTELAAKSKELGGITAAAAEEAHKFEIAHKTMTAETGRAWTELGLAVAPVTNQISLGWERMKLAVANVALTGADLVTGFRDLVDEGLALVGSTNDADAALKRLGGDLPEVNQSLKGAADGSQLAAKGLDDWRKAVEGNKLQVPSATESDKEFSEEFGPASAQLSKIKEEIGKHIAAVQAIVDALEGESKKFELQKEAIDQVIASHTTNIDVIARVVDAIDKLQAQHVKVTQSTLDWANANRTIKGTIDALHGPLTMLSLPIADNTAHLDEMAKTFETARSNIGDLEASVNEFHNGITIAGDTMATVTIPMFATLEKGLQGQPGLWDHARDSMHSFSDDLEGGLQKSLEDFPRILSHAFTGRGGIMGAVDALGSDIGKNLGLSISKNMKFGMSQDAEGNDQQSMLGSLVTAGLSGGVAGLVNLGVGKLTSFLSNIGKPSQQELQGRQTEAQFEQQMGGWQGIQKALTDVGVSAEQANGMIQQLWASEKQGSAATQTAISAITSTIDKHTADVSKGIDGILAAAKTVGANFPAAMQPMVDKLLSLPGLTDAEKKSLNDLLKSAEPDFKQLTEMAGTYGLKLTDLGPQFEQADISGRADKIVSDFGALTKAGADVGGVLHGMGKSINDLVTDALKYGSTLPTALKPLVEELAKTGQLTDESGKKFTDVSKLTFDDAKDPLAKGLSNLTSTIQNLIDLLSGQSPKSLSGAIDVVTSKIPKNPFRDWQVPDLSFNDAAIPMAKGGIGRVTRPTLFLAGEHGAEDFAFSGGGKRFGGGGMTMGDTHLTFNVHGATDPQIFAQTLHHVLRTDTGLINTAIQIIADKRIAAAA